MARQTPTHVSDTMLPYRRPDPVTVALIMRDYGESAVHERWNSWSTKTLAKLASEGRGILDRRKAAA